MSPFNSECLFLLSTWFHLWCFYRSVFPLLLILYSLWKLRGWLLLVIFSTFLRIDIQNKKPTTENERFSYWLEAFLDQTVLFSSMNVRSIDMYLNVDNLMFMNWTGFISVYLNCLFWFTCLTYNHVNTLVVEIKLTDLISCHAFFCSESSAKL